MNFVDGPVNSCWETVKNLFLKACEVTYGVKEAHENVKRLRGGWKR